MTTPTCPICGGAYLLGHPGGDLVVQHRPSPPCSLGLAQDATQAADHERLCSPYAPASLDRPATAAEVTLAAVLGLPAPDAVTIRKITDGGGVVRREPRTSEETA